MFCILLHSLVILASSRIADAEIVAREVLTTKIKGNVHYHGFSTSHELHDNVERIVTRDGKQIDLCSEQNDPFEPFVPKGNPVASMERRANVSKIFKKHNKTYVCGAEKNAGAVRDRLLLTGKFSQSTDVLLTRDAVQIGSKLEEKKAHTLWNPECVAFRPKRLEEVMVGMESYGCSRSDADQLPYKYQKENNEHAIDLMEREIERLSEEIQKLRTRNGKLDELMQKEYENGDFYYVCCSYI
ncbi:unnamed protein product [Cylicocyclus nassatus]|uniref:Uncharacterized protein n=1 Tax=Cylicocyclus nassatus TaxID=53992 RepID=A0AA36DW57_CYLNA|nr:unnamed protein product [Cylicocyclus nassatus]